MKAVRNGFAAAAGATLFGVVLVLLSRALTPREATEQRVVLGFGPLALTLDQAAGLDAPTDGAGGTEGGAACSMLY
jgi:hypothetical protein